MKKTLIAITLISIILLTGCSINRIVQDDDSAKQIIQNSCNNCNRYVRYTGFGEGGIAILDQNSGIIYMLDHNKGDVKKFDMINGIIERIEVVFLN